MDPSGVIEWGLAPGGAVTGAGASASPGSKVKDSVDRLIARADGGEIVSLRELKQLLQQIDVDDVPAHDFVSNLIEEHRQFARGQRTSLELLKAFEDAQQANAPRQDIPKPAAPSRFVPASALFSSNDVSLPRGATNPW